MYRALNPGQHAPAMISLRPDADSFSSEFPLNVTTPDRIPFPWVAAPSVPRVRRPPRGLSNYFGAHFRHDRGSFGPGGQPLQRPNPFASGRFLSSVTNSSQWWPRLMVRYRTLI